MLIRVASGRTIMMQRLTAFSRAVERYRDGCLEDDNFQSLRLPLGVYYQKPETSWMVRVPLRGGRMTGRQARYLAERARRYEGRLHLTTRQNVQLHCVPLEEIPSLLWDLLDLGVVTYGASGDGIRSVKLPARHGLAGEEDLFGLLWKLEEYFVHHPLNMDLPRKFKITLAGKNPGGINLRGEDLGIRRTKSEEPSDSEGFRVFAGGGLGALPRRACLLADGVSEEDLPYLVEAIVQYFHERGDRENRNRARLKFLLMEHGEESFRTDILERYRALRDRTDERVARFDSPGEPPPPDLLEPSFSRENQRPGSAAGQNGSRMLKLQTRFGDVPCDDLARLSKWSRYHGNDQIRIGCDQNLYVPHADGWPSDPRTPTEKLKSLSSEPSSVVDNVCPGVDYCALGLTSSRDMAARIEEYALEHPDFAEAARHRRINISGCPNSCAWYQRADIGLSGSLVRENGERREAYALHRSDESKGIATCLERGVPAEEVPERLHDLLREDTP